MRKITTDFGKEGFPLLLMVIFGFAAFKTAQGSLYSTAMLSSDGSFILVSNLEFSVVSAIFVVVMELVVILLSVKKLLPAFSLPVVTSSLVLCLIAGISYSPLLQEVDPWARLLVTSFVQGVMTVLVTLAWIEMFARMVPNVAMKALGASMLVYAVLSAFLQKLPSEASLPLIIVLLLINAILYRRAQGAHKAIAKKDVSYALQWSSSPTKHVKGLFAIGEGMLSLLAFGCTIGVINGFMLVGGVSFEGSSNTMSVGALWAAIVFFVIAFTFSKTYNVSRAYKILFPVVTTVLAIWPFAQFEFTYYFSVVFVAGHSFISTSVMYLIIRESRKRTLNPYMFMGMAVVFIRLSSVVGLLAGSFVAQLDFDLLFKTMLVIVIVLYLLSLVLLFMVRTRKAESLHSARPQEGEIDSGNFDRIAATLASEYGLTEREKEILSHLARGRTANSIGKTLYLSPNTVRGYIKSIYVKLDVHSKQEVIDLFFGDNKKSTNA